MKRQFIIGLIGCTALLAACKKTSVEYVTPPSSITIYDIVKVSPSFSLFREAITRTGVDSLLSQPGPFTLLLPDNNAFAEVGILRNGQIDSLDTAYLHQWLLYHILPQSLPSTDVPVALQTTYLNMDGDTLYFSQPVPGSANYRGTLNSRDQLHVNGDTVLSVDTKAANGLIHVLSSPLKFPVASVQSFLASDTSYSFFVTALQRFGLYDQLTGPGPYTILAPSNSAFLQWGITLDSINSLDTAHFKKYLFGVSVLASHLIFNSDFIDGPVGNGSNLPLDGPVVGAFFSPDGILAVQTANFGVGFYALDPVPYNSYLGITYYLLGPGPTFTNYILPASITDPDHVTHNGVVHGLNNILIYPDSVRIQ